MKAKGKQNETFKLRTNLHWIHWLIIFFSLVLTFFAWYFSHQQVKQRTALEFQQESKQIVSLIDERMVHYEDALWGGVAYISAVKNHFNYKDWQLYADKLDLTKKYPGINGIGVIYNLKTSEVASFNAEQQKLRPYFKIYPAHDKPRSLPIVYIEPLATNRQALGLDMAHENNRYTAAIKAAKTDTAQITGPITLVQDEQQTPGFLLFVPFYKNTKDKSDFLGLVYAPFIMNKLINGVIGETNREVAIRIKSHDMILYDELNQKKYQSYSPMYTAQVQQKMYGQVWDYTIISTPEFTKNNKSYEPIYILIGGLIVDALLLCLFIVLVSYNKKATLYAKTLTADLKERSEELHSIAHFDILTKLPNRVSFLNKLKQQVESANQSNTSFAVIQIDVNKFKRINEFRGYEVGDELLMYIATTLQSILGQDNYVARMTADEFAILLTNVKTKSDITLFLNLVQKTFSTSVKLHHMDIHISLSMGVAIYPSSGATAKELFVNSDIALNQAQIEGSNKYVIFNEAISEKLKRMHNLDFAMRQALENDEFNLVYQPQLDLTTKRIIGFEALLRWDNGLLGPISPDEFIILAEQNNMIIEMGQWVIDNSCQALSKILEQSKLEKLKVSINASIPELLHKSYVEYLEATLQKYKLRGENICIEVTESVLMNNTTKILTVLNALKKLNIQIALDDFGTGYSSMQYLKDLPVSILKIDKSFIQDIKNPDTMTIVTNTIHLAHGLSMKVMAEGVDNEQQVESIFTLGCDYAQGYYFYTPMSWQECLTLLMNK